LKLQFFRPFSFCRLSSELCFVIADYGFRIGKIREPMID
jgi:hypothetical protein